MTPILTQAVHLRYSELQAECCPPTSARQVRPDPQVQRHSGRVGTKVEVPPERRCQAQTGVDLLDMDADDARLDGSPIFCQSRRTDLIFPRLACGALVPQATERGAGTIRPSAECPHPRCICTSAACFENLPGLRVWGPRGSRCRGENRESPRSIKLCGRQSQTTFVGFSSMLRAMDCGLV